MIVYQTFQSVLTKTHDFVPLMISERLPYKRNASKHTYASFQLGLIHFANKTV